MMDHFREDIVSRRQTFLPNLLYALCWAMIVVCGLYALTMLQFMLVSFSVPAVLITLISGGIAVGLFFAKDRLKLEYEYTFTNGSLDFAKVMRSASRKELGSMNVKNITACGHVAHESFQRYLSMQGLEKKNWFLNRDGNLFYFYYMKDAKKHMIIIEPSEEMVEMIRPYLAAGVYQG